jgi:hypothetical protein
MEKELAKKTLKNLQEKLNGLRYGNYNALKDIEKAAASVEVDGFSEATLDLMWKESRREHTNLFENLYNSVSDYIATLLSALHVYKVCPNLYEGNDIQRAMGWFCSGKAEGLEIDGVQVDVQEWLNEQSTGARIEAYLNYISNCRIKLLDNICCGKGATLRFFKYYYNASDFAVSTALTYDGEEDVVFNLYDWQGSYPKSIDEIGYYSWRAGASVCKAIMLDGMPRLL